jgi:hypothetical protein
MGKALILLAICLLSGCSILEPKVDIGTLAIHCMELKDRDTTVVLTDRLKKLECKR